MNIYTRILKRPVDVLGSTLGIVVSAPFAILISLAIRAESEGGVFYTQERIGRNGVPFQIVKFRSMLTPEDSYGSDGEILANYDRVTRVGRALRATSLDELPQLLNIFSGDMSLIGPRPTLPYQVDRYTAKQRKRLDVRPGLTGLAQVSGRNSLSWTEKIEKDLEYVQNISALLDLKILLRTVLVVFRRESTDFVSHDSVSEHSGGDSSAVWAVPKAED